MNWTPENIRALRVRLGWTQRKMGMTLGYNAPQVRVAELENGKLNPGGAVCRLLDILDAGHADTVEV